MKQKHFFYVIICCFAMLFAACSNDDSNVPSPAGGISGNDQNTCPATGVELVVGIIKGAESYKWYKDGVEIPGANETIYIATETGIYTVAGVNASGTGTPSVGKQVTIEECKPISISDLEGVYTMSFVLAKDENDVTLNNNDEVSYGPVNVGINAEVTNGLAISGDIGGLKGLNPLQAIYQPVDTTLRITLPQLAGTVEVVLNNGSRETRNTYFYSVLVIDGKLQLGEATDAGLTGTFDPLTMTFYFDNGIAVGAPNPNDPTDVVVAFVSKPRTVSIKYKEALK